MSEAEEKKETKVEKKEKKTRNTAHSIELFPELLYIHYTCHEPAYKGKKERSNRFILIKLRFYSYAKNKLIGKGSRVTANITLKEIAQRKSEAREKLKKERKRKGIRDKVTKEDVEKEIKATKYTPTIPPSLLLKGIEKLFAYNDVDLSAEDVALSDMLITYWIKIKKPFCDKYMKSDSEKIQAQKMMAHICLHIGNKKMSALLGSQEELDAFYADIYKIINPVIHGSAFKMTSAAISGDDYTIDDFDETITNRTRDYAKLLRDVFHFYLYQNGVSASDITSRLRKFMQHFKLKRGIASTLSKGLRPKTLSINDYNVLWSNLNTDPITDIKKGEMLMLFMGLSADEVCALDVGDFEKILDYDDYRLCITKKCILTGTKDHKKIEVSDYLDNDENYRNVPVPKLIADKLYCKGRKNKNAPLLLDPQTKKRLEPTTLENNFKELFSSSDKNVIAFLREDGTADTINVSFRPSNYIQSLRYFYKNICNLHDNEIRYLLGDVQKDTAGRHYIDFNNAHKQYRMLTQMSYGLMLITAPPFEENLELPQIKTYGNSTYHTFSETLGQQRHVKTDIQGEETINIKSTFGVSVCIKKKS